MRNIVIYLLCSIFLMATFSFGASAASNTFNITELEGKYKTQGRTELVDGTLYMDWSASGIEFKANCSGDVSIKVNSNRINTNAKYGLYFTVIVDGVAQYEDQRIPEDNHADRWTSNSTNYPFKIEKSGESEFTIAKNLSSGTHTFEIYTQTEADKGAFGIKSITLNGEFLTPNANNDLYIEFVGDSITAGLGNISTGGQDAPLYQDATRGWAYLTAKKLNADWSVIAQSGITASNGIGWAGKNSISMQTVYPKWRYFSNNSKDYGFSRKADVVVLGLGTNDVRTYSGKKTLDDVKSEFKNMINLIKTHNPNAKIVCIYGMMTQNYEMNDTEYFVCGAVDELGGADKGLYTLKLPKNTAGGQGHPNLAIQPDYANRVAGFIQDIIKPTSSQTPTQSTPQGTTGSRPNNSQNSVGTGNSTANSNVNNTSQNVDNTSSSANGTNPGGQQQGSQSGSNIEGNNSIQNPSDNTQNEAIEVIEDDNTGSKMKLSTIIIIVVMAVCAIAIGVLLFFSSKFKNT